MPVETSANWDSSWTNSKFKENKSLDILFEHGFTDTFLSCESTRGHAMNFIHSELKHYWWVYDNKYDFKADALNVKAPRAITNLKEYDLLASHPLHIIFRK